ncbi:MAG: efflux RND transporter periplasmic adaptor subunit [Methylobacterium sp.]|nr:efflux RND transporter periplasmic adaptor subunit [Methylobacterium sp.]
MTRLLILLGAFPLMVQAALPFATAEVAYVPVGDGYAAEAVVEAGRESSLAAQVAGRILALDVEAGDAVKAGQLLVRIDDSEARNSLAGNQAQVAQAQANLANARAQFERTRILVSRKFVSPSALDKAQADYQTAEAEVAAAEAGVAQSSTSKGFTHIKAPFSGLVSARLAQVGEMASPGRPLLTLFDPATLRVVASIPQENLQPIRQSGHASIEFPSLGKWIESRSVTVLPAADSRTHVSQVRIALPADAAGLYPGMFARAHFSTGQTRKMLVPASAVVRRSEVTGIYVVQGEKIQFRQLRIGRETPAGLEVLAGLRAGETIALDPVKAGIRLRQQTP